MSNRRYVPQLDGIRAIAVLLVVLYHLGVPGLSGGYVGVDIFFVLSGFLITRGLLAHEVLRLPEILDFYKRRFCRLYPASCVVVLVTLLAGIFLLPSGRLINLARSSQWALLGAANVESFRTAGYWDHASLEKPLLHYWSLAVEEQFYLIYPLALFALLTGTQRHRKRKLLACFAPLALLSLGLSEFWLKLNPPAAFYVAPLRAWEFLVGALAALCFGSKKLTKVSPPINDALCLISLGAVGGAAHFYSRSTPFPGLSALAPCLGTAILILASERSRIGNLLAGRPAAAIGQASYAIYLVHWPLIVFYSDLKNNFLGSFSIEINSFTLPETGALFGLTLLAAMMIKRLVEDPFRFGKLRRAYLWPLLLSTAAVSILAKEAGGTLLHRQWVATEGLARVDCAFTYDTPDWKGGCGLGVKKPEPDVFLLGDSHMEHFAAGFDDLLRSIGKSGLIQTQSGCVPVPNGRNLVLGKSSAPFDRLAEKILATRAKIVILAARWDSPFRNSLVDYPDILPNRFFYGPFTSKEAASSKAAVSAGLRAFLAQLAASRTQTLIMSQVPFPGRDLTECRSRPSFLGASLPTCFALPSARQFAYQAEVVGALRNSAESATGARVIDLGEKLCVKETCTVFDDEGTLLYRDSNHLSSRGGAFVVNKYLRPEVLRALAALDHLK